MRLNTNAGDIEYAAFSTQVYCYTLFLSGKNLEFIAIECKKYSKVVGELKQERSINNLKVTRQLLENLMATEKPQKDFSGTYFDEEEMLPILIKANDAITIGQMFLYKSYISYLLEDYEEALASSKSTSKYMEPASCQAHLPIHMMISSLILLALITEQSKHHHRQFLAMVKRNQKKPKHFILGCRKK